MGTSIPNIETVIVILSLNYWLCIDAVSILLLSLKLLSLSCRCIYIGRNCIAVFSIRVESLLLLFLVTVVVSILITLLLLFYLKWWSLYYSLVFLQHRMSGHRKIWTKSNNHNKNTKVNINMSQDVCKRACSHVRGQDIVSTIPTTSSFYSSFHKVSRDMARGSGRERECVCHVL